MNLKELAAVLGLSPTTVSRALNGYPEVNEQTRARVVAMAERHNYQPNRRAIGLATGRTRTVAHLVPRAAREEVMNPVFAEFIAGASSVYNHHDYELLLSIGDPHVDPPGFMIERSQVDGYVVHIPLREDPRIALLEASSRPFIVHGRAGARSGRHAFVDVDNHAAFAQATQLLIDLGHRRFGLINGLEHYDFAWRRRLGMLDTLEQQGIGVRDEHLHSVEMSEHNGYRLTRRMLEAPHAPTALLVSSHILALGAYRALGDLGHTLGQEVSIVSHDDDLSYFSNRGEKPLFTATRSSVRLAGERAATHLLTMIVNPSLTLPQELLQAELVIGHSTGTAPSRVA